MVLLLHIFPCVRTNLTMWRHQKQRLNNAAALYSFMHVIRSHICLFACSHTYEHHISLSRHIQHSLAIPFNAYIYTIVALTALVTSYSAIIICSLYTSTSVIIHAEREREKNRKWTQKGFDAARHILLRFIFSFLDFGLPLAFCNLLVFSQNNNIPFQCFFSLFCVTFTVDSLFVRCVSSLLMQSVYRHFARTRIYLRPIR